MIDLEGLRPDPASLPMATVEELSLRAGSGLHPQRPAEEADGAGLGALRGPSSERIGDSTPTPVLPDGERRDRQSRGHQGRGAHVQAYPVSKQLFRRLGAIIVLHRATAMVADADPHVDALTVRSLPKRRPVRLPAVADGRRSPGPPALEADTVRQPVSLLRPCRRDLLP